MKETKIANILIFPQQSLNRGIGKDRKLTAAKATLLCSLTSRTTPPLPTPIHSLSYKSHDPSVNYLTTQAGMGEKLENSISKLSKSLAEETERYYSPPSPPISFIFAVKTHFQSFLEVTSDVWHQHILLGREIKGGKNFWEKKVVLLVCQCQMHCAELIKKPWWPFHILKVV